MEHPISACIDDDRDVVCPATQDIHQQDVAVGQRVAPILPPIDLD
jgi:hypothetical protein